MVIWTSCMNIEEYKNEQLLQKWTKYPSPALPETNSSATFSSSSLSTRSLWACRTIKLFNRSWVMVVCKFSDVVVLKNTALMWHLWLVELRAVSKVSIHQKQLPAQTRCAQCYPQRSYWITPCRRLYRVVSGVEGGLQVLAVRDHLCRYWVQLPTGLDTCDPCMLLVITPANSDTHDIQVGQIYR